MKTKICSKCKREKTLDQFYKGDDKNDLHYWCKSCFDKKAKIYRDLHKKQYKIYCQEHKKEMIKYQQEHKVEISQRKKSNYQKNKKEILKKSKIYKRNKLKNDINYKILCNLRTRIWEALKGINKSASTLKLLGCHIDLLRLHLQSKFQPGMSFSNYGEWHIDHIIPCQDLI